jgi:hypothetical protein
MNKIMSKCFATLSEMNAKNGEFIDYKTIDYNKK